MNAPISRMSLPQAAGTVRKAPRGRARRLLVAAHLWLGLIVGAVWALQGLTGAALVFHREIDRWSLPAADGRAMAPIDMLLARAEAVAGAPITRIGVADARGDLLSAAYTDAGGGHRALLLDAATGDVVGNREDEPRTPLTGSASRWLYTLHEALLMGDRGETLVGASGLLLLTAAITGLWLGWPRRKAWRAAFAARRWRTAAAALFGWHRMVGLVAGLASLATIPAGAWMIFQSDLRPALARAVPFRLPYKPAPEAGPATYAVTPGQALAAARARFPDARFVRLTPPTPKSPAYAVRLRQPGEVRAWSGVTTVSIDPATGRTLDVYDPLAAPAANRVADAAFSVHNGEIARLPGRLLVFMSGLALPALWITGVLAWARKRRARIGNRGVRTQRPAVAA